MSSPTLTQIWIQIIAAPGSDGKILGLNYAIGEQQACDLQIGRCPPDFDVWGRSAWESRRYRAQKLAELIASDVAHKLIQAFNDEEISPC